MNHRRDRRPSISILSPTRRVRHDAEPHRAPVPSAHIQRPKIEKPCGWRPLQLSYACSLKHKAVQLPRPFFQLGFCPDFTDT